MVIFHSYVSLPEGISMGHLYHGKLLVITQLGWSVDRTAIQAVA